MNISFSPSINIVRDADKPLYYLPTNNSKQIFRSIAVNFDSGLHSFTIVGSYGTGKSAFLLAFEKTLRKEQIFFEEISGRLKDIQDFQFINIVGSYRSLIEVLAEELEVKSQRKNIMASLRNKLKSDKCLVITIDEFGKLLEYAASNNPDEELYFIQQIAELANDPKRNFLFITTLHQNFDAYASDLKEAQKKEWEKVKGRLKELTFNEPVEQLLALAADRVAEKFEAVQKSNFPDDLLSIIKKNSIFPLRNELTDDFARKLFPFEPLSAAALTLALQKYGQNERSLFTFLDTKEYLGLEQYDTSLNPYYNLSCVYDYFLHNYYSILTSRYNPDYFKWTLIRNALERIDAEFEENIEEARQLIKSVGLLNALGSSAAKVNTAFLKVYAKVCLGIENIDFLLGQLQGLQLIRYRKHLDTFILYEGSDIDIEEELEKLRATTGSITNLAYELKNFLTLEYAAAKSVAYRVGTPRFFSFIFSEQPLKSFGAEEIDGYVNLVFSIEAVEKTILKVKNQPILHAVFSETQSIKEQLFEIKVLNTLFLKIDGKDPAKREVQNLKDFRTQQLRVYLLQSLFENSEAVQWYFNGETVTINSRTAFNKFLSVICETIYHKTPILRNELINKHKLSGNISLARKNFIGRLLNDYQKEDFGFTPQAFPPEKTIYYTLLKNTGIHKAGKFGIHYFDKPDEDSGFQSLWEVSNHFLESATVSKKHIADFITLLSQKPLKLKSGFIEFWIPTFLYIKREEIALYYNDRFIPFFNDEILEVIIKDANRYFIKTFAIDGVKLELFNKYRSLIQQEEKEAIVHSTFLETIKPFLIFYKRLPNYTKNTNRLTDEARAYRKVAANAQDLESVFFEDLPRSFGLSMKNLLQAEDALSNYIKRVREAMRELNVAYPNLVERIESHLLEELGLQGKSFHEYKAAIKKRYTDLPNYLLDARQKITKTRLLSTLDDREKYIDSISSALIGKDLKSFKDTDEPLLHKKLLEALRTLDNLVEMSKLEIDKEEEQVVKIEITKFQQSPIQQKIILTKAQSTQAASLQTKVKKIFKGKDSKLIKAILIQLLEEELTQKS